MTQTLDVAGRFPQRDSARAIEAPVAETQTRSKLGTFAITFGIASTLLYTVYERLNWPLFTYLPRVNRVEFWVYRSPPAESPPMYWYGWTATSLLAGAILGFLATLLPEGVARKIPLILVWLLPILSIPSDLGPVGSRSLHGGIRAYIRP